MHISSRGRKRPQKLRAPRVQMTYDVEVGGDVEARELPFVMGVVGDFAGDAEVDKKKLKERTFVAVGLDNFDDVMAAMAPRATYAVPNLLAGDATTFKVDLRFGALRDFRPETVLAQVEPLRKLLDARNRLADLRCALARQAGIEEG